MNAIEWTKSCVLETSEERQMISGCRHQQHLWSGNPVLSRLIGKCVLQLKRLSHSCPLIQNTLNPHPCILPGSIHPLCQQMFKLCHHDNDGTMTMTQMTMSLMAMAMMMMTIFKNPK